MSEAEISTFLDSRLKLLRSLRSGAGDREILEAKRVIGVIEVKFNFEAVRGYARRSHQLLDRALAYRDFQKKNETAVEGAEYFADRIFATILECEKNKQA